jgi:lipid-binding SYLF domain-containing protein
MIRMMMGSLLALLMLLSFVGCTTAPRSQGAREDLVQNAERTLDRFRRSDPGIERRMNEAHGYAVFPTVGKGGMGVGGAYGRGVAYEQGRPIGYCDLTQGTVGLQLGGQRYSQLILFEDQYALDRFRSGEFALAAQASAVAAAAGAGANAPYNDGVLVYTLGEMGLMYEASVGGQRFSFYPM